MWVGPKTVFKPELNPKYIWSARTCIIRYKYIWVPKLWGILDPKYPKNVIFVFAVLSISIFVLVFVFGVLEKSNICTFPNDIWICIWICWFQNKFPNYFSCTKTTNTKQRGQEPKLHNPNKHGLDNFKSSVMSC